MNFLLGNLTFFVESRGKLLQLKTLNSHGSEKVGGHGGGKHGNGSIGGRVIAIKVAVGCGGGGGGGGGGSSVHTTRQVSQHCGGGSVEPPQGIWMFGGHSVASGFSTLRSVLVGAIYIFVIVVVIVCVGVTDPFIFVADAVCIGVSVDCESSSAYASHSEISNCFGQVGPGEMFVQIMAGILRI